MPSLPTGSAAPSLTFGEMDALLEAVAGALGRGDLDESPERRSALVRARNKIEKAKADVVRSHPSVR